MTKVEIRLQDLIQNRQEARIRPAGESPSRMAVEGPDSLLRSRYVSATLAANAAGWVLLSRHEDRSIWEDAASGIRREAGLHRALAELRQACRSRSAVDALEAYFWSFKPALHSRVNALLDRAAASSKGRTAPTLLDVGCGDGGDLRTLASGRPARGWVGYDVAADRTLAPEDGGPADIRWVRGHVYRLPFLDGSFDLVLASEIVEHLCAPAAALREWSRVLAPGGRLVVTTPNGRYPLLQRLIFAGWRLILGREPNRALEETLEVCRHYERPEHFHEYGTGELHQLVGRSGFEVEGQEVLVPRVPDSWYGRYREREAWRKAWRMAQRVPSPSSFGGTQMLWARKRAPAGSQDG